MAGWVLAGALLAAVPATGAEAGGWTLESSVQRVLEVAPERRAAEAEVAAREGELVRDTAWPNPTVEGRSDRKLGIEDGTGGSDVTQLAVTQPLPLLRLSRQRAQAEANLAAAQAARHYRRLLLENQVARAFHQLQFAETKRALARERAEAAQQYAETGGTDRRLVRYLSPLDRTRLAILRESARQTLVAADGEWSEAAARFRALLALSGEEAPTTAPLNAAAPPPSLSGLKARLDAHSVLIASQRDLDAARAGIDVARSSRFADPTLTLFRSAISESRCAIATSSSPVSLGRPSITARTCLNPAGGSWSSRVAASRPARPIFSRSWTPTTSISTPRSAISNCSRKANSPLPI